MALNGGPYIALMHVKLEALLKWLRIAARAEKSSLMGVPGVSFQMGVRGPISVNLGVIGMKRFENPVLPHAASPADCCIEQDTCHC